MSKELQIKMLEQRIALLSSRTTDNKGVIAKLKRKVKMLQA